MARCSGEWSSDTRSPAAPLSALVREMIVSAQAMFGADADHTEMAKWLEKRVGDESRAH